MTLFCLAISPRVCPGDAQPNTGAPTKATAMQRAHIHVSPVDGNSEDRHALFDREKTTCRSFRRAGDRPHLAAMVVRSRPQVKRDMRSQPARDVRRLSTTISSRARLSSRSYCQLIVPLSENTGFQGEKWTVRGRKPATAGWPPTNWANWRHSPPFPRSVTSSLRRSPPQNRPCRHPGRHDPPPGNRTGHALRHELHFAILKPYCP